LEFSNFLADLKNGVSARFNPRTMESIRSVIAIAILRWSSKSVAGETIITAKVYKQIPFPFALPFGNAFAQRFLDFAFTSHT
jgi:hypothetical protein